MGLLWSRSQEFQAGCDIPLRTRPELRQRTIASWGPCSDEGSSSLGEVYQSSNEASGTAFSGAGQEELEDDGEDSVPGEGSGDVNVSNEGSDGKLYYFALPAMLCFC